MQRGTHDIEFAYEVKTPPNSRKLYGNLPPVSAKLPENNTSLHKTPENSTPIGFLFLSAFLCPNFASSMSNQPRS